MSRRIVQPIENDDRINCLKSRRAGADAGPPLERISARASTRHGSVDLMVDYSLAKSVQRVKVTDEVAERHPHDYADAFSLELPTLDSETPATWVIRGLTDTPLVVKHIARLFGRDESSDSSPIEVLPGWHVVQSTPDLIEIERTVPLMQVRAVGRKVGASGRLFTSVLSFRRPILARVVWLVVGIGHRRMSKRLVAGNALPYDT